MSQTQPQTPFYVVSMGKFSALFFGTMGMYQLYWFYKHWQLLGKAQQRDTQPIIRAIFDIFFIPFLCNELAKTEREKGQHYRWNPRAISLGYIALQIIWVLIYYYVYQKTLSAHWLLMQFPLLFGHFYYLYKFQLVANRVSDDPFGKANAKFTPVNHGWIIFGVILWLDQVRALYSMVSS